MNLSNKFLISLVFPAMISCNQLPRKTHDYTYLKYQPDSSSVFDLKECSAILNEDTLILENSMIRRRYLWNDGNIISLSLTNKISGKTWNMKGAKPDAGFPGSSEAHDGDLKVYMFRGDNRSYPCLTAEVYTTIGQLNVRRSFRIYPSCPAITCTYYLQGKPDEEWKDRNIHLPDLRGKHSGNVDPVPSRISPVIERLDFDELHWKVEAFNFLENSDYHNTLVEKQCKNSYVSSEMKSNRLNGTLLLANETLSGQGIFILKESPPSEDQLAYPGWDFVNAGGEFQVYGLGILPSEISQDHWERCYGYVTGVTGVGELEHMISVRNYLKRMRYQKKDRDEMVMMNTWGDRNRGENLSEEFCLNEIQAAHRLGITHYQLDAGWQVSMEPGETGFFTVDPSKFPHGLDPLLKQCHEYGMELCLWTRPSTDYTYSSWETFADSVIAMYKKTGIRTYKFDGVIIDDHLAEKRIRALLEKIMSATDNQAVINLDITRGNRWGYHYFNEYGNFFVENRYTDWNNYFPHWTLRNLWMLSAFIPPPYLQIEFLNKWRNPDVYQKNDPLAPSNVPFDYIFSTTIMAQPLAWFEATGLPEEGFKIAPMVKKYTNIMTDLHSGYIFPIGEEPSGTSWTGFQSIDGKQGYIMVYREYNDARHKMMQTWLPSHEKVKFHLILGQGKDFTALVNDRNEIGFTLPGKYTFALYKYILENE